MPSGVWAANGQPAQPVQNSTVSKTFDGGNVGKKVEPKKYDGDLKSNTTFSKTFNPGAAFKTKTAVLPDKKVTVPAFRLDQRYPVSSYPVGTNTTLRAFNQTPIESKNSPFSSKGTPQGFAKTFAVRSYAGPEAVRMKQNVETAEKGLGGMKDLPDRSLTIDEVRELLNRDTTGKSSRAPLPESSEAKSPPFSVDPAVRPPSP